MANNQLLPFGTGGGANVLDYATYSAGSWRLTGFTAGTAVSQQLNTVWRQGSFGAAMIGQYVADYSGQNVNDDGDVATFEKNFVRALRTQAMNVYTAGGTANALTVTSATGVTVTALALGLPLRIVCTAVNTAAPTLAVDGLAAKNITYPDNTNLAAGELIVNKLIEVIYNSATDKFVMVSRSDSGGSKTAPFYGLQANPATTFNVATATPTVVTTYGTIQNGLSANTTFTSGILTIGTGDDGYYLLSNWLGTNLPTGAGYGWTQAIDVSTNGGTSYVSKGGIATVSNSNATNGAFAGISVPIRLNVADKVRLSFTHNYGSTQNAPCGFSAVFLGK